MHGDMIGIGKVCGAGHRVGFRFPKVPIKSRTASIQLTIFGSEYYEESRERT
jgi:hypothetical protein